MKIAISPAKNPLIGWDVTVTVTADDNQKISRVTTSVGGFNEPADNLDSPAESYERTYIQMGVYPGHNEVVVTAQDTDGNQSVSVKKWDS